MKRHAAASLLSVALLAACGPEAPSAVEVTSQPGTRDDALVFGPPTNACGNAAVAPVIISNTIKSPTSLLPGGVPPQPEYWNPSNGHYSRGGISYASGGGIRFELVTDKCTTISSVRLGSQVITPTYTNGWWYSEQAAPVQPTAPNQYAYNLWVFYPQRTDGQTETLSITVGRAGGFATTTYNLPLVRVEAVNASFAQTSVGFSRAELHNMFARAIFAKFNGAQNSTQAGDRRIYGYDPSSLVVSVDSNGIGFSFKFKADVNNWCDPTVRAFGKFKLNANQGLSIQWVNPADSSLSWPTLCTAAYLVPFVGTLAYEIIESRDRSSVLTTLEEAITSALPDASDFALFLTGSSSRNSEVLVHASLPVPSIRMRIPYDAYDMVRTGTAFPAGDLIGVMGSGLGMSDQGTPGTALPSVESGPNGVPQAGSTTWPNPAVVTRTAARLLPDRPVGRLLARTTDLLGTATTYVYTPGCAVRVPSPRFSAYDAVKFGVNDSPTDAQRLRGFGTYTVSAAFLSERVDSASLCTAVGGGQPPLGVQ